LGELSIVNNRINQGILKSGIRKEYCFKTGNAISKINLSERKDATSRQKYSYGGIKHYSDS